MKNEEILKIYSEMVPFIAQFCGPSAEVLVHDVTNPEHSVIAIANGFHSGRVVGSPMTELAKAIATSGEYKTKDFITNYEGTGKGKNFVSSTYFIKNEDQLIGFLCINRDISALTNFKSMLDTVEQQFNLSASDTEVKENLDTVPIGEILSTYVSTAIQKTGIPPKRMTPAEKTDVVLDLADQGVVGMKGAIKEIASQLDISEPTIYRYLHKASSEESR